MREKSLLLLCSFLLFACKKDLAPMSGCTDNTAVNYNANTITDDGSCTYLFGDIDEFQEILCFGDANGEISITNIINGSGSYNYNWFGSSVSGSVLPNCSTGTYSCIITDNSSGCDTTLSYTISEPPLLSEVSIVTQDISNFFSNIFMR